MKLIHLSYTYSIYCLLLTHALQGMHDQRMLSTIFVPIPLLELHHKKTKIQDCIQDLKQIAIPLTCCFLYGINKNNIWADIMQNSLVASIFIYLTAHYYMYHTLQNQQHVIYQKIIHSMQDIFHCLIIGQGIYNKIVTPFYNECKLYSSLDATDILTLQLFLNNAYHAWDVLFSYYQKHYKDEPLYIYDINHIDIFEILQASNGEQDILPFVINFYDKHTTNYNYKSILDALEHKLELINHQLKAILLV